MSRPRAEEQFLEQNPWANPQHPIHQHAGRLSRQVSDQTQLVAATSITPGNQRSLVDPNKTIGSASTIPEHLSAQASSTLATPHTFENGLRLQTSGLTASASSQQLPTGLDMLQQNDRLQSLSPTETRKHNFAVYGTRTKKPDTAGETTTGTEETNLHPHRPSSMALFGPSARSESFPRNHLSSAEMSARHTTSSPLTLHQHARENNITTTARLSRIGAR